MAERWGWQLVEPGRPLERTEHVAPDPKANEVVVEVAGCGVCHTDLGFLNGDVAPRKGLPIVLGHEITGKVVEAGAGAESWAGRNVLVPAVIPCGDCPSCAVGRGNVCARQTMPGNDCDGGFATHLTVPAVGLCPADDLPEGLGLAELAVVADAVTTPLQAIRRADVQPGDLCIVVGCGGVGTHAVQIAAASGAHVVAVDVDEQRLAPLREHGASATVDATGLGPKDVRARVREHAKAMGAPKTGWTILECSGTAAGQETAFALLGPAATLGIVGFTRDPVTVRLSNLMAFDADAFGSWGCPVERYPEAVELVRAGRVVLQPFVRRVPLAEVERALSEVQAHSDPRRVVLVP